MGQSTSKNISEQTANVNIMQQFSGTCDVVCQNTMSDVSVSIIDSTIGGSVNLNQTCSTNASCLIGSTMNAVADAMFKDSNTANAKNTSEMPWFAESINTDTAENISRQTIREAINQSSNEHCNVGSYNQMNNISIFAANSTIGGNISISQNASTSGQCRLTNSMRAAATATGQTINKATSGKDKKGEKFGNKTGKLTLITYLVIGIVVIVIVSIVGKIIAGMSQKGEFKKRQETYLKALAKQGCPGGGKPLMDPKTKLPILNPVTQQPMCPPPQQRPVSSRPPTNQPGMYQTQ